MNATVTVKVKSEDYFVGPCDNGMLRLGLYDVCAFDVPSNHPMFATFESLLSSKNFVLDAEAAFDACFSNPAMSPIAAIRNAK